MFSREHTQQIYLELAESYDQHHDEALRDIFLMLAADTALRAHRPDEADRLRQRLLRSNPHHMLQAYLSFEEAAREPDVQAYLDELRMRYPPEIAQEMLEALLSPGPGPIGGGGGAAGDDDYLGTLVGPGPDDPPGTLPPQRRTKPNASLTTDFGEALGQEMEAGLDSSMPAPPPPPAPPPLPPPPAPPEDEPVVYRVHPELEQTLPPQAIPRPGKPPPVPPQNRSTPQTRLDVPRQPPPRAPAPPARPNPPARPPEPKRQAAPAPPPKPAPKPAPTRPVAARPAAPAKAPAHIAPTMPVIEPDEPAATGGMVSVVLFAIVLLSGLALAVFTLWPRPLL